MRKRNWGRIINTASAHGLVASAQKSAYVAAKHGIVGLTKVAALETATTGVTVNAICPGWVLTPLVEKQIQQRAADNGTTFAIEKLKLVSEKQPSMEFTTPEQIGDRGRIGRIGRARAQDRQIACSLGQSARQQCCGRVGLGQGGVQPDAGRRARGVGKVALRRAGHDQTSRPSRRSSRAQSGST